MLSLIPLILGAYTGFVSATASTPLVPRQFSDIDPTSGCSSQCAGLVDPSQSPSLATLCTATIVADLATCYDCIVAQSNGVLTADTAQLAVNAFVQSCQLQGIALSSATVSGASLAGTGLPDTTDLSGTGFAGPTTSVSSTIDSTPVVVPTLAQSTTGVTSQTSSFPPSSTSGSTSPATIPGLKGGASYRTISRCTFGFAGSIGLFLVI